MLDNCILEVGCGEVNWRLLFFRCGGLRNWINDRTSESKFIEGLLKGCWVYRFVGALISDTTRCFDFGKTRIERARRN